MLKVHNQIGIWSYFFNLFVTFRYFPKTSTSFSISTSFTEDRLAISFENLGIFWREVWRLILRKIKGDRKIKLISYVLHLRRFFFLHQLFKTTSADLLHTGNNVEIWFCSSHLTCFKLIVRVVKAKGVFDMKFDKRKITNLS